LRHEVVADPHKWLPPDPAGKNTAPTSWIPRMLGALVLLAATLLEGASEAKLEAAA